MKKLALYTLLIFSSVAATAQAPKTDIYDFIKLLLNDSTDHENVGDWGVENAHKYPIVWKAGGLEISPDTSINFYRTGSANVLVRGRRFKQSGQPIKWNIMLKGARSGYTSFSILTTPSKDIRPKYTIDSIINNKPLKANLLASCDQKTFSGYYYYEIKIPGKDVAFIKLSWLSLNGSTALRVDCFDTWNQYAAKLDCL